METSSAQTGPNPSSKSRPQHHHTPQIKEADLRDGRLLLDPPTFTDLGNGRLRCIESGHDLHATDKDRYALSKACRLALIDSALARNEPPLNIFKPSPLSKSKLVCKLTGDTINKTEEHIWKHINGKRFLNKSEQKEAEESGKKSRKLIVVKKDNDHENEDDDGDLGREMAELGIGTRTDDGSTDEDAAGLGMVGKDDAESVGLSMRTKRTSAVVSPSSFAFRKKKSKKSHPGMVGKDDAESVGLSMRTKRTSAAVGPSSFASRKKKSKKSHPGIES